MKDREEEIRRNREEAPQDSQFDKEHRYFRMQGRRSKWIHPRRIYLPYRMYLEV
jgi:hypothetical protein